MSEQPDLFRFYGPPVIRTPASRRDDPETSHLAEASINANGSRDSHRAAVLAYVRSYPGKTCTEIAAGLGWHRSVVSKRLPELEPQYLKKGVIVECTIGRTKQHTWWPA